MILHLFNSPVFGVLITLIAFEVGLYISKKIRSAFFNPLMIAISLIIIFIQFTPIELKQYQNGAQLISFFLGPATVILAIPLYKNLELLKSNLLPILFGIFSGSCINISLILIISKALNLTDVIKFSLIPKSTTTPIGIALSSELGGIPEITIAAIIITGITGTIVGPPIFRLLKIDDPVAKGIALGTASHAIGTVKAFEIGETEGALSSLAISLTGLITVLIAPLFIIIFC